MKRSCLFARSEGTGPLNQLQSEDSRSGAYVASDRAKNMTGGSYHVDGGIVANPGHSSVPARPRPEPIASPRCPRGGRSIISTGSIGTAQSMERTAAPALPADCAAQNSTRALAVAVGSASDSWLTACGIPSSDSAPSQAGSEKRHKIVLSLNNIAVSQRLQGANGAAYVARTKYRNSVDFQLKVSEDTVSAQIASLQQIIRGQPDAILVNAASETALTQVTHSGLHTGIVVCQFR